MGFLGKIIKKVGGAITGANKLKKQLASAKNQLAASTVAPSALTSTGQAEQTQNKFAAKAASSSSGTKLIFGQPWYYIAGAVVAVVGVVVFLFTRKKKRRR